MIAMFYLLTGSIFYWLAFKRAPMQDEAYATHPAQAVAEVIELFPEYEQRQAA